MSAKSESSKSARNTLPKAPIGIKGLDEVTSGGLPRGRTTLVCSGAGCGKTLLAAEFIVRGATEFNEPGVFVMFEESEEELAANVKSLGFDLPALVRKKKVALDHVALDGMATTEIGQYDLDGLFARLAAAIDHVGAKRVVIDTIEVLFSSLKDHSVLRSELQRLFRWLKERGVTAVVTAEGGRQGLTRAGLEEYVADCVIVLDHRVKEQISTRRLRIVKYRGSVHGTNEFPFLISDRGISMLPITSLRLQHRAAVERISTGIPKLDEMLGGKGVFRGSSTLISGTPGTGKSTIAMSFVDAACRRGERCLVAAYEESEEQLLRNMASVGYDLKKWIRLGRLRIFATRPTLHGLEEHLLQFHNMVDEFAPSLVSIDPLSNLAVTEGVDLKPMLMRLIDFLKVNQITALFTCLISTSDIFDESQVGVSSLMDTWILLRNLEYNGERNRTLYVVKSRGTSHSNQVREFVISSKGLDLVEVYVGQNLVLTGTARAAQEAREHADALERQSAHERDTRRFEAKQKAIEAQIASLRADAEVEALEAKIQHDEDRALSAQVSADRTAMRSLRDLSARSKKSVAAVQRRGR